MATQTRQDEQDEVSARIHAAAETLFEERGIDGIQVRDVAKRAGTSTMGVYSRFGGKPGLLEALFLSGFARLHAACEPFRGAGEPLEELERMAQTYRETAIGWPHHYDLMFGRGVPDFEPSPSARAAALESFQVWGESVKRATAAGLLRGRVNENAMRLWALVHGLVGLELSGMMPEASERAMRQRLRGALRAYLTGLEA